MFMLKAHLGDTVAARTEAPWRDKLTHKAVTQNVMIAYAARSFLQGRSDPAPRTCHGS